LDKLQQKFVDLGRLSLIKVKALDTRMSTYSEKKVRKNRVLKWFI